MKVVYGSTLPPGLPSTTPTRGELKVRIERLQLQDALIPPPPPGHALVPVDHCAVGIQFWGEAGPSTYCVPATDTIAERGTQCCVFPVRTMERQLQQYLLDMSHSEFRGMRLHVAVPPQFSGKKGYLPVGLALVDIGGLTLTSSIQGWFNVVFHADKSICIGRVKLSTQLTFFQQSHSSSAALRGAASSTRRSAGNGETTTALAPSAASAVGIAQNSNAAEVEQPNAVDPEAEQQRAQLPILQPLQRRSLTTTVTTQQQQPPLPDGPRSGGAAVHRHDGAGSRTATHDEIATVATAAKGEAHDANDRANDIRLREWFSRGLALRNQMQAACHSEGFSSHMQQLPLSRDTLLHRHPSDEGPVIATSIGNLPISMAPLLPSAFLPYGPTIATHSDSADSDLSSSTTSLSSVTTADAVELPHGGEEFEHGDVGDRGFGRAAASPNSGHNRPGLPRMSSLGTSIEHGPRVASHQQAVSQEVHGEVVVQLHRFAFSAGSAENRDLHEFRVRLRLSRDVQCLLPEHAFGCPISSFVHRAPLRDNERGIEMRIPVERITSESKMVLELVAVTSSRIPADATPDVVQQPDGTYTFSLTELLDRSDAERHGYVRRRVVREHVVGISVVGIFDQCPTISFRSPLTGDVPVHCRLIMALHPSLSSASHQPSAAAHGTTTDGHLLFRSADYTDTASVPNVLSSPASKQRHRIHRHKAPCDGEDDESAHSDQTGATSSDDSESTTTTTVDRSDLSDDRTDGSDAMQERRTRLRKIRSLQHRVVVYPDKTGAATTTVTVTVKDSVASAAAQGSLDNQAAADAALVSLFSQSQAMQRTPCDPPSFRVLRLHVAVVEAKELPKVYCCRTLHSNAVSCPQGFHESAEESRYTPEYMDPSPFVALQALTDAQGRECPVPWFVEASVQGVGARSVVHAKPTSAPKFLFESILRVGYSSTVAAPPSSPNGASATQSPTSSAVGFPAGIGGLSVGVFHHSRSVESSGVTPADSEEAFWAAACPLGTAVVDLAPLKYMSVIDAWHKVFSQQHAVPTVIGYVHIVVRAL